MPARSWPDAIRPVVDILNSTPSIRQKDIILHLASEGISSWQVRKVISYLRRGDTIGPVWEEVKTEELKSAKAQIRHTFSARAARATSKSPNTYIMRLIIKDLDFYGPMTQSEILKTLRLRGFSRSRVVESLKYLLNGFLDWRVRERMHIRIQRQNFPRCYLYSRIEDNPVPKSKVFYV